MNPVLVRRFAIILLLSAFAVLVASPRSSEARPGKKNVDLLVTGGLVVTMNPSRTIYDNGAVAIQGDDVVVDVGQRSLVAARPVAVPAYQ